MKEMESKDEVNLEHLTDEPKTVTFLGQNT
jgi:hypothetical protein